MSKTNELALANGYGENELSKLLDYAFQPVMNGIESAQHEAGKVAVEQVISAVKDVASENLPHATEEDVIDTVAERIRRSKAYSRTAKMLGAIVLMLWRVGFRTQEAIVNQLERKSWQALADRCLLLTSAYDLISRLYGAGIKCKLADIRAEFRNLFNSALNPHDVKKRLAEHMLGEWNTIPATEKESASQKFVPFSLAERTFKLFVIGETVKYFTVDNQGNSRESSYHVLSALERYETAKRLDAESARAGNASDTASALRLSAETIKAENTVYLQAEVAAIAEKKAKAEAEAQEKAQQALDAKKAKESLPSNVPAEHIEASLSALAADSKRAHKSARRQRDKKLDRLIAGTKTANGPNGAAIGA